MDFIGEEISPIDVELSQYLLQKDYMAFCQKAVASGKKNLVIAGATGSGKTTFMLSSMGIWFWLEKFRPQ